MADPILRILVPLDGSPEAECVFPSLSPLFRTTAPRVTLFRVVTAEESPKPAEEYLVDVQRFLEKQGVEARTKTSWGRPTAEILWQAHPSRYDFIAMTTHGRTGWRRLLMGSVAEEVLRHSELPLLINRAGMRVGNWRRIVVALDGSAQAEEILPEAVRLARTFAATLHLVRVSVPRTLIGAAGEGVIEIPAEDPMPYLRSVADKPELAGIEVVLAHPEGAPGFELSRYAEEQRAGLVCATTHGRSGLGRLLLGSTAEDLLRIAPCAVLVRRTARAPVVPEPVGAAFA